MAEEDDLEHESWVIKANLDGLDNADLYIAAMYYSVTTITTVGYGDISGKNTYERILSVITMILGVIAFSYATSALSSLVAADDLTKAPY